MKKAVLLILALLVCLSQPAWSELIDNGNGTVTDTETNLTWQKDSARDGVGNFRLTDWNEALYFCESLDLGGKQDWRLPASKWKQSSTSPLQTRQLMLFFHR